MLRRYRQTGVWNQHHPSRTAKWYAATPGHFCLFTSGIEWLIVHVNLLLNIVILLTENHKFQRGIHLSIKIKKLEKLCTSDNQSLNV